MIHCSSVRTAGLFLLLSTLLFACDLPQKEVIVTVEDQATQGPPIFRPVSTDQGDVPIDIPMNDPPDAGDAQSVPDTQEPQTLTDTQSPTDTVSPSDTPSTPDTQTPTDTQSPTVDDGSDAKVASSSYPAKIKCGKAKTVSVTMKNVGTTTWKPKTHRLVPLSASPLFFDQNSIPLSKGTKVKPNQSVEWVFELVGPTQKGTHLLRWRMQSGDFLFGKAAKMTIQVNCPKPPLYPPAIAKDFSNVVWMLDNKGEDISDWPETVTLKASKGPGHSINLKNNGTTCGPGDVCWPTFNPSYVQPNHMYYEKFIGSAWIFVYQEAEGVWVAGVFESIVKNKQKVQDHNFYEHLKFPGGQLQWFEPQSGERYGWMISSATDKAGSTYTVNERSNVSEFVWP